jgi:hypothetical protein
MARFGVAGVAVLCGVLAACPYFVPLSSTRSSLILVYLSQLPLFVGGLWGGVTAAALAGLTASLILLAASNITGVILFAALNALPVILLVRQALLARTRADGTVEWYPPGLLAAWLTALGLTAIMLTLLVFGGPDDIQEIVREILAPVIDRLVDETTPARDELVGYLAMIMPGVVIASWMVMTLTNGSLAQGLLARFSVSWRPSPTFAALELPTWFPLLLLLAAAGTALEGVIRFIAINVMIILIVPFCLAGLAVLHTIAYRFSHPAVPLVGVYVLAGVFGWPLLLVILLGMLDTSFGIRRHIRAPRFIGGKNDG